MSTFYDNRNRPHTLTGVDNCFTYLHSLKDNSAVKIANKHFTTIFKERPLDNVPTDGWPMGGTHVG